MVSYKILIINTKYKLFITYSLFNRRLFLRYPAGNGLWLDNSNVFSTYAINPSKVLSPYYHLCCISFSCLLHLGTAVKIIIK